MSSDMFRAPLTPCSTSPIDFWNISAAELTPKMRCLYQNKPMYVANVVTFRDFSSSASW